MPPLKQSRSAVRNHRVVTERRHPVEPGLGLRVLVFAAVLVAVSILSGCGSADGFCDVSKAGPSSHAVITSYLRACGSDYSISRGPYDGDKPTTQYASYAQVVEYTLNVKNNSEGGIAFVMVGQRTAGGSWQTLGSPGTGP